MKRETPPGSIFLLLMLSLFMAACSSGNAGGEPANTADTNTGGAAAETVDIPEPEPTAIPEPTAEPEPEMASIVISDGLGSELALAGPARRIISLAPSNTEILFAIGAGDQVIGRDSFSDYPDAALEVTDIGGGFSELDMETIIALEPDLVLAADITPPEQVQGLQDVGLPVFALANPTDLPGMYENLRTVAQLTGHEAEAESLIADLQERVAAVTGVTADVSERPLVFYELDGTDPNAPWTSGSGTFIDRLLEMAGGENLGAVLDGAWAQISIEELIAQDPDIILLGDALWGGVTPESVAAREGWDGLTAVSAGNVHPFNDNLVSRPGPRLVEGLEEMARFLHPELFN